MSPDASKIETLESLRGIMKQENPLEGLAMLPYLERITHFIRGSTRHRVPGGVTVVDFRPLYTVNIHHIQSRLARCIADVEKNEITERQLDRIRRLLRHYTDALRDFEFIHGNRWNTQFVKDIAASRLDNGPGSRLQAALISELQLESHEKHSSLFRDSDLLGSFDPELMEHSTAVSQSLGTARGKEMASEKRRHMVKAVITRFGFAVIGGLIIIVPMFILTWGHTKARTLAVVATSICLFALGVAVCLDTEPHHLLAVTAAYAAVLMTLVDTGNNGISG